jgi:hypothetical protein
MQWDSPPTTSTYLLVQVCDRCPKSQMMRAVRECGWALASSSAASGVDFERIRNTLPKLTCYVREVSVHQTDANHRR